MELLEVFENIKVGFSSLWSYRIRGNSIEIITPFQTTTSKFVSVFITKRENQYVVTDAGWLFDDLNQYDTNEEFDSSTFQRILSSQIRYFDIKQGEKKSNPYYYLKTTSIDQIPVMVFDMATFISSIVSVKQLDPDTEEEKQRESFSRQVNSFFQNRYSSKFFRRNYKISDDVDDPGLTFNAGISKSNKVVLISYITGSNKSYFEKDLSNSIVKFELLENKKYADPNIRKMAIFNDEAKGFEPLKITQQFSLLKKYLSEESVISYNKIEEANDRLISTFLGV